MNVFNTRNEMVRSLLKPGYIGTECGVLKGDFSEVLYQCQPARLDLVDLWESGKQYYSGDHDGNNGAVYDMNDCYNAVCSKFSNRGNVNVIRSNSLDFFKSVPDNTYDFVYLDTDHSYEFTILELNVVIDKVKVGGFICGHDFDISNKCNTVYHFGVDRAVFEFCHNHNQKIHSLAMDGCMSFAIQKR